MSNMINFNATFLSEITHTKGLGQEVTIGYSLLVDAYMIKISTILVKQVESNK